MYEERKGPPVGLLVGGGVAFVALLVVLFFTVARKPEKIPAPVSFSAFASPDRTFSCQIPEGWEKKAAGQQGGLQGGVTLKKGGALIDVTSDEMGAIMGDIDAATNRMASGMVEGVPGAAAAMAPPPVAPVEKAHKRGKKTMASKFKDYEEKPMLTLNSGLGEGRCSEWTGKGSGLLGAPMHGYRATFLNTERRITVRCECPEQDWPTLKPAFEKIVASLGAHRG